MQEVWDALEAFKAGEETGFKPEGDAGARRPAKLVELKP